MPNLGLLATFTAQPGKEDDVKQLLLSALPMAEAEQTTLTWYAFQMSSDQFGIFDTFDDQSGRDAHLSGDIADALMANADSLLVAPPTIQKVDLIATK